MRAYSKQTKERAIALHRAGWSHNRISTELGLPQNTVRNWVVSHHVRVSGESQEPVPVVSGVPKYGEADDPVEHQYAQALAMYEESSVSIADIVRTVGCTYHGFVMFLRRRHPDSIRRHNALRKQAPAPNDLTNAKYSAALREYEQSSLPMLEVVKKHHVSYSAFRYYLKIYHPESIERHQKFKAREQMSKEDILSFDIPDHFFEVIY